MALTPPPGFEFLSGLYDLINTILEAIEFDTGGRDELLKSMSRSINDNTALLDNRIYDSQLRIQDSVASVGTNVDYTRAYIVDKISAKVDSIGEGQNQRIDALTSTVVQGNLDILNAIKLTNDNINHAFDQLGGLVDKIVSGLKDALTTAINDSVRLLDSRIEKLTDAVTQQMEKNTEAIKEAERATAEKLQGLTDTLKSLGVNLIEQMRDDLKQTLEEDRLFRKELTDTIRSGDAQISGALGNVAGAIVVGDLGIASAITLGFATMNAARIAKELKDDAKMAPLWAWLAGVLPLITSFGEQALKPLIDDPEKVLADVLAAVVSEYFNIGRKTYESLHLDEEA